MLWRIKLCACVYFFETQCSYCRQHLVVLKIISLTVGLTNHSGGANPAISIFLGTPLVLVVVWASLGMKRRVLGVVFEPCCCCCSRRGYVGRRTVIHCWNDRARDVTCSALSAEGSAWRHVAPNTCRPTGHCQLSKLTRCMSYKIGVSRLQSRGEQKVYFLHFFLLY